jgi:DNA polymerase III subunit beta
MILSVLQENLLSALSRVGRIVPARPQLPIVQNILLTTEEKRLKIIATSLDITEIVWVGAKVEKDGGICVPARLLLEFITTLPKGTVTLTENNGSLMVQCAGYKASIPGISPKEFPPVIEAKKRERISIEKEKTVEAIEKVAFSAATDEGRPLLTGVRIIQKEGEALFAATDGYRLSVKRLTLKTKDDLDLLVPARALFETVRACAEEKTAKDLFMVKHEENQVSFIVGDAEIQTRLIDGEYPDFEKIIPAKHNTRVLIEKEPLLGAVKSSAIFARDNANIVKFHIEGQTLTVSANTPQVGEDRVEVEVKVDGDGGDIAFNSRFLLDFLANYKEDELLFEMTGSLNPGVFKPTKDSSYIHIIMPVRVQG